MTDICVGIWDRLHGEDPYSLQIGITPAAKTKDDAIQHLLKEIGSLKADWSEMYAADMEAHHLYSCGNRQLVLDAVKECLERDHVVEITDGGFWRTRLQIRKTELDG